MTKRAPKTPQEIALGHGVPYPLAKASIDPFDYAIGLRDGTVIRFETAEFDRKHVFVTLRGITSHTVPPTPDRFRTISPPFNFERGLVVRISEIAWATDAPEGS